MFIVRLNETYLLLCSQFTENCNISASARLSQYTPQTPNISLHVIVFRKLIYKQVPTGTDQQYLTKICLVQPGNYSWTDLEAKSFLKLDILPFKFRIAQFHGII